MALSPRCVSTQRESSAPKLPLITREGCSAHADRVLVGADRAQDEGMGETRWHFGTGAEVFGRHARGSSGAVGRQEVPGRAFTLQEPHVEVLRGAKDLVAVTVQQRPRVHS